MTPKFRAWDKVNKKLKQVYSINFDKNGEIESIKEEYTEPNEIYAMFDIGYFELMQSTGLKDINGTEIYEGDIVKVLVQDIEPKIMEDKTHIGVVFYKQGTFDIKISKDTYLGIIPQMYMSDINCVFEILGNKYQYPELLEDD